ncbi:uncharacterized protein ANIA_11608 [Aspergillus nidulans FGSC A4]|uniref:Uncharacterized protein n=1 Tax=Emericella nidulans (strain FGSC A4 / ATCC 38163 / CBS 112.46 / NRRL 194 / M139) TaxID=227321 RepID=C8VEB6_EMENI|nr:hypothetical protein [Aspergillus nidulans FGSC A4]CBF80493.1 TPA: hypothetical protein ANIA_11608 [Aspergillus nidulans FGSC A4]
MPIKSLTRHQKQPWKASTAYYIVCTRQGCLLTVEIHHHSKYKGVYSLQSCNS